MRTESGDKGFINICHTSEIPPPKNISEEELVGIATSDEPSFVIPMSIGQERLEPDKGNKLNLLPISYNYILYNFSYIHNMNAKTSKVQNRNQLK